MSTYLNFSVQTVDQIKDWIIMQMGWPLYQVEITDSHLQMCINDSIEEFTKYVIQDEEYLALNLDNYNTSGFTLPGNVQDVFAMEENIVHGNGMADVNSVFSVANNLWNAGLFVIPHPGIPGGWVNYELAAQYTEMVKRLTASKFYFNYNERTKLLTLIPNPTPKEMSGWICVGCKTIRTEDYQYGESWVKRYALAGAKCIVGNVRGKFANTNLLGGGTVSINFRDEGLREKDELRKELMATYPAMGFYIG